MSHAISCGFFNHPGDNSYGASPDGLVAPGILLEIKTRAANSDGPLPNIAKNPGYYIQAQIQMVCTDYSYCIIMSYHPESKTANYFLVQRNTLLWSVIKIIVDSIRTRGPIFEWKHKENKSLSDLEKNVFGRIPEFESLKPLRSYINKLARSIQKIKFVND